MTRKEKALEYFRRGFHCSQAVLASYADLCGLTEKQALKLGACFGSGMRKGEVCGACSGALMVLGSLYGQYDLSDATSRQTANEVNELMMQGFAAACGSCLCSRILGCDLSTAEGIKYAQGNNLFKKRCPQFVENAMDVLAEIIRGKQIRMDNGLIIREALPEDAERLVEIYSHYVLNTAVSFEYTVPSVHEFTERIRKTKEKYPWLVCEKNGQIIGYAYAGAYSPREAYVWTAATSIYVDKDYHRQGAGTLLYEALEERLLSQGIVNLLAGVAYCDEADQYLTHDSRQFHLKMGYTQVARMKEIGKKFDRWYDLLWMQKKL